MTAVKNIDTGLEARFLSLLVVYKLPAYRRYGKGLPGTPDFVFMRKKVAVFVDSCFWHGCSEHLRMPKSNVSYWKNKISGNKERDRRKSQQLRKLGWRVIRIWEHDLRRPASLAGLIKRALDSRTR